MNEQIQALIKLLPAGGSKEQIPDGPTRETIAQLYKHGAAAVKELTGMLKDAEAGGDAHVRYGLYNLAVYAGTQDDNSRADFARALADTLDGEASVEVKSFIIRQLQLCGVNKSATPLARLLADEKLGEPACAALSALGGSTVSTVFRAAVPKATGRMRVALVQALGQMRDAGALEALRAAAADVDAEVRLAAVWALASAASAADTDLLLAVASKETGYRQAQARDACFTLADRLATTGDKSKAEALLRKLSDSATGDESKYIREAADRAIKSLAKAS